MVRLGNPGVASSLGWRGSRIRPGTALPSVASASSSSTSLVPLSEAATARGSTSRLCSPRPRRRRGGSHGARARGSRGVSLAPRRSGPDPPPRRPQQQGPRGAPGRSCWPPGGTDRQGAARSRAAQALGSAAAAAAPAVGDPEQLQARAAHLGARTWLEWRSASGTLTPEQVRRSPPPSSPVLAPPKVWIRLCAAGGGKKT